ncbi:hypothetical protein Q9966_001143 [Columba livia]|nr:hypothetical protein Q9966_001143 [Columba livia]KAK2545319.1 hypothetical protein Q9966_001143 [Columba livia]
MHGPGPPVHGGTPTYKCVHPCAPCPLGSQGLLLLWQVALSCRTPTGCSPLPADNAKAYFKRAKAHAAVWNEREAREDFLRVAHLDPSMAAAVKKELKQLGERMRKKHVEDRKRYQGLFQPPRGPRASAGQEDRQVGDGAMLQGEAPQGEVGVPETPGQGEQGAGTEEAEQPGADRTVGGEGAAAEGTGQGQPADVEVEVRDGMRLGEEANLGTCGAEPESWESEEKDEKEKERDEEEEEGEEKKKEEDEVEKEEEEVKKVEEAKKKEREEEREEEEEEREEEEKEREEEEKEREEKGGEEEDEKVEKERKKGEEVETEKDEVKKVEVEKKEEREEEKLEEEKVDEDKEEESPAAEMENLSVGQCGEQETCGAEGAGTWSMAETGPCSEGLGPAKGTQELEGKTPREVLEERSCGEQRAGISWGNAGESTISPDSFTPGAVLQAGHLGASEELGGGAEVTPAP